MSHARLFNVNSAGDFYPISVGHVITIRIEHGDFQTHEEVVVTEVSPGYSCEDGEYHPHLWVRFASADDSDPTADLQIFPEDLFDTFFITVRSTTIVRGGKVDMRF